MSERRQFALQLVAAGAVIVSTAFAPTAAHALSTAPLAKGAAPQGESTHSESAKEATQDSCKRNANATACGDSGATVSSSEPRQECPEAFRKYEELEKETGKPQTWRGCEASYPAPAFGDMSILLEGNKDGTRVIGVALTPHTEENKTFYLGLNLQMMDSPRLSYLSAERNSQKWNICGFLGLSYPAMISPYIEGGGDLLDLVGGMLWGGLTSGFAEPDCKTQYCPRVDAYVSIGIQNRPKRNTPLLRGYAKWYWVGPNQRTVYVPVVGVSLGWPID